MKKIFCVFICLVLGFSVFSFVGCDSSAPDLSALEKKIASLEHKLSKVEKDNADLEDKLSKVPDYKAEIDVLKGTVANLAELIKNLDIDNSSLTDSLDKLKAQVDGYEVRIAMLESLQNGTGELPVYEVGVEGKDTFTFVNNGIKLFSVRLISYAFRENNRDIVLNATLINYAMPTTIQVKNYFDVFAFNASTSPTRSFPSQDSRDYVAPIEKLVEMNIRFALNSSNVDVPIKDITHFYLGIPNQTSSLSSLIPYAIFKLAT